MTRKSCFAMLVSLSLSLLGCSPADNAGSTDSAAAPPPTAAASNASAKSAAAPANCRLTMGWDPWEPYQYRTVDGEVRGLDVDLVAAMVEGAGCELSFEEGRWATLLRMLQRGTVDVLTGASRTSARETFAYFSAPYREETFQLFIRSGEGPNFVATTLAELLDTGFRVGITEQYVYGDQITALQEDPRYADQFVGATVGELNYSRLLDLGIEGFLEDPFVAATILRRKGMHDQIESYPLEVHSGEVHLMYSKNSVDQEVVRRIDESLQRMRNDGSYDAILDKYRN